MECDAPFLKVVANCRANSTARFFATAQSAVRGAGTGSSATACHAPSPETGRQLPQPQPHSKWQADDAGRALFGGFAASCRTHRLDDPGRRRRHTTSSSTPDAARPEEGHLPTEIEPGTEQARVATMMAPSPAPSPRIPRSIRRPARWCSSATTPRWPRTPAPSGPNVSASGVVTRSTVLRRLTPAWHDFMSPKIICCFRPPSHRQHRAPPWAASHPTPEPDMAPMSAS